MRDQLVIRVYTIFDGDVMNSFQARAKDCKRCDPPNFTFRIHILSRSVYICLKHYLLSYIFALHSFGQNICFVKIKINIKVNLYSLVLALENEQQTSSYTCDKQYYLK